MASAIQLWKRRVNSHHAQSLRAQKGTDPEDDFWRPLAPRFQADLSRTDDPVLKRLCREITPTSTVLDVGGGAGRFALPLAMRCRHVTVVEPSQSMIEQLSQGLRAASISNVTVVHTTWEEVEVNPADVVLCAHVLYGIKEIEPFVLKLTSHALKKLLILMHFDSPQSYLAPLWARVHGEKRITLLGLRELLAALWEMDIYPDLDMLESYAPYVEETWEQAQENFRHRLYVSPGTEADRRLEEAMTDLLIQTPDGLTIRGAPLRRLGLLSWKTQND